MLRLHGYRWVHDLPGLACIDLRIHVNLELIPAIRISYILQGVDGLRSPDGHISGFRLACGIWYFNPSDSFGGQSLPAAAHPPDIASWVLVEEEENVRGAGRGSKRLMMGIKSPNLPAKFEQALCQYPHQILPYLRKYRAQKAPKHLLLYLIIQWTEQVSPKRPLLTPPVEQALLPQRYRCTMCLRMPQMLPLQASRTMQRITII